MKIRLSLTAFILAMTSLSVQADTTSDVSAMSAVVFAQTTGLTDAFKLSVSEQLVAKKWQIKDGKLADATCGVVPHTATVVDLNRDGKNEVILLLGNECTSGKIGSTIYLFTPEADNRIQRQLGFSAAGYKTYQRQGEPWADLVFMGNGDCQPVWHNKNGRYNFHHLYEAKPGACSAPAGHVGE